MHIYLGYAFGRTHYVGRVHGLVGRYHNELLNAVFDSEVGHVLGAEHVGENGFRRVALHHGHVFVGGGMEYVSGLVLDKGSLDSVAVRHVAYEQVYFDVGECRFEFELHVVHRGFGLVEQHDFRCFHRCHLSHYLAADRACCAGNHHHLSFYDAADKRILGLYGFAAKQVFDADIVYVRR